MKTPTADPSDEGAVDFISKSCLSPLELETVRLALLWEPSGLVRYLTLIDPQAQWWSAARNTMDWVFLGIYLAEFALKIFADRLAFFTDGWYTSVFIQGSGLTNCTPSFRPPL